MVTMHPAAIDTSRPAVAVITPEGRCGPPRVCLGWWQADGGWADADLGPGATGLAEAIRADVARSACSVAWQSFTGDVTRPYIYDPSSPTADGSLVLPRDPAADKRAGLPWRGDRDRAPDDVGSPRLAGKELSDIATELVEEVMRRAVGFEEILKALVGELPEDAFPGRENATVLLEMLIGTVGLAVAAAGEEECRLAIALVAAIRERVLVDLLAAAERSREDR